jgi:hypothetical protein
MFITFFLDGGSFIKEVDDDSSEIFLGESDCINSAIKGFDIEGILQKSFPPLFKHSDMTLSIQLPYALPDISKMVKREKLMVSVAALEKLPMLLGRLETETGKRMMEDRFKNAR